MLDRAIICILLIIEHNGDVSPENLKNAELEIMWKEAVVT